MDNDYPCLKRPKKKLVYPTTETRVHDQWAHNIATLDDVDKIFNDLDSRVDDFVPLSPEIHIPAKSKSVKRKVTSLPQTQEQLNYPMSSDGDRIHKPRPTANPKLDIASETPFKSHGPIKTSSPIEENATQHETEQKNKGDSYASPILLNHEDENQDLETAATPTSKNDKNDDSFFETLLKKMDTGKMSEQKKKTEIQARLKPSGTSVCPARSELKAAPSASKKSTENVQAPNKAKRDKVSFLQKLKDANQPKPTLPQAKVAPSRHELEPEDDFLILEDDVPFRVSIPNKFSKNTKDTKTKAPSSDIKTKGTGGGELSADEQQAKEKNHRPESKNLSEKTNKKSPKRCFDSNPVDLVGDPALAATAESADLENQTRGKKRQVKKPPSKIDKLEKKDISSRIQMKGERLVKRKSKCLNNDKGTMTSAKDNGREVSQVKSLTGVVEPQNGGLDPKSQLDDDDAAADASGPNNIQTEPLEDPEDVRLGQKLLCSEKETSDEDVVLGKRKRRQPGEWWIASSQSPEQETEKQQTGKKPANTETSSTSDKAPSARSRQRQTAKNTKKKKKQPIQRPVETSEGLGWPIRDSGLDQDSDSFLAPLGESRTPTDNALKTPPEGLGKDNSVFHKVYQRNAYEKKSSSNDCVSRTKPNGALNAKAPPKRIRKSPGKWWETNPSAQDVASSQPRSQELKTARKKKKTNGSASEPAEGATKKQTVSFSDESPPGSKTRMAAFKNQNNAPTPPAEDREANHSAVCIQMDELPDLQEPSPIQDSVQEHTAKIIKSGPSSMIAHCEEDDIVLPSTTVQPALCMSDLCAAPLRPLLLQSVDQFNLKNWLKSLWPAADKNIEIRPEDFEWYCHRGKAMGLQAEMQTGTICTGKMLLGSSMKKPLWVDHSATTVFHLLTGSVSVTVDCDKSRYSASQSFMVPPGHAYSIQNLNAQPAVLHFTRFFTEDCDE